MTVSSALVLGGSGGIGSAVTRRLAEHHPVTVGYAGRTDRAACVGGWDDVASAVMMLCAPDAGWVTGAVLDASGGLW